MTLTGEMKVAELHRLWTHESSGSGENDFTLSQVHHFRGHLNALLAESDLTLDGRNQVPSKARDITGEWYQEHRATLDQLIRDAHASDIEVTQPVFSDGR